MLPAIFIPLLAAAPTPQDTDPAWEIPFMESEETQHASAVPS